jgi:signal transduction histidine kinase
MPDQTDGPEDERSAKPQDKSEGGSAHGGDCCDQPWMETGRLAEVGLRSSFLVHEVRQPLFAIKALVQIILSSRVEPTSDRIRQQLSLVLEEVTHLEELLERYSTLSRRSDVRWEPFDLHEVARSAAETVSHRAARYGVRLGTEYGARSPVLRGDATSIRQVLVNVLQNAIDATADKTGGYVEIATRDVGTCVEIEIRDNGCGVQSADANHVFEPFYTTKPPGKGTGLGLAIAREILEQHGGCIGLSPEKEATVFVIRLPRVASEEQPIK